jgi:hypothetical protein
MIRCLGLNADYYRHNNRCYALLSKSVFFLLFFDFVFWLFVLKPAIQLKKR